MSLALAFIPFESILAASALTVGNYRKYHSLSHLASGVPEEYAKGIEDKAYLHERMAMCASNALKNLTERTEVEFGVTIPTITAPARGRDSSYVYESRCANLFLHQLDLPETGSMRLHKRRIARAR